MSGYRVQTAQFPKEYIAQQRLTVRDQGLPVFRCRPRLELAEQHLHAPTSVRKVFLQAPMTVRKVIFNVFKDIDAAICRDLLRTN